MSGTKWIQMIIDWPAFAPRLNRSRIKKRPLKDRNKRQPPERPACSKCSTKDVTVLMVAGSTQRPVTYYYCPSPNCKNSAKVWNP